MAFLLQMRCFSHYDGRGKRIAIEGFSCTETREVHTLTHNKTRQMEVQTGKKNRKQMLLLFITADRMQNGGEKQQEFV